MKPACESQGICRNRNRTSHLPLRQRKLISDRSHRKVFQNRYDGTAVSKRIWGAGSDVLSYAIAVEELSRVDGDHYVLNGGKIFITNADKAYVGMS